MPSTEPPDDAPASSVAPSRRRLLQASAGAVLAGLAGCSTLRPSSPTADATVTPAPVDTATDTQSPGGTPTRTTLQGPWPTTHADAANTGAVDAAGPAGTPSVRWRGSVALETATLAAAGPNGTVATQRDGTVVAHARDGTVRWRHAHDAEFVAAPVVAADGTVVVGSRDGTVTAYDAAGERRWQRTVPDGVFAPHANDATPFRIHGDTVILAHPRGEAVAFALADGTVRWRVAGPVRMHRPAIADGRVFLAGGRDGGGNRSTVLARSLADGATLWRASNEGAINIGPGVAAGTVYAATIDGLLVARDAASGNERWRVRIDGEPWLSTIPVVLDDRVWVGTLSDGLYAVTADGVQTRVPVATPTTPAVGEGRLYVGSTAFGRDATRARGTLLALAPDGSQAWTATTRGTPESAVGYRDGRVVVGTATGVVDSIAAADGRRRWRAFHRPAQLPQPAVGPATVYCGSRGGVVSGYRATDGTSHLWGVRFDAAAPGTPTVAADTIVAGSHAGQVAGTPPLEYADPPTGRLTRTPTPDPDATPTPHVDAPSPDPRWQRALDGPVGDTGFGDGLLYVGSGTEVVALTVDGTGRWATGVGGPVRAAPAVVDGTVYVSRTDGTVLALAAADGTERWRQSVGEAATAPAIAATDDGRHVVVGTPAAVVTLGTAAGERAWVRETDQIRGTPAIADGTVVVGDDAGVVRCLSLHGGADRWRRALDGAVHGSPAIADGTAYVGSRDGHLYALSLADGTTEWALELPDWVDGSPAVAYGAVFVVDQSGVLSVVVGDE